MAKLAGRNIPTIILVAAIIVIIGAVVTPIAFWYTSRPEFCAGCHEQAFEYNTWKGSSHNAFECLECHAEPGVIGLVKAKVLSGLKDVYVHYTNPVYRNLKEPATERMIERGGAFTSSCLKCHTRDYVVTLDAKAAEDTLLLSEVKVDRSVISIAHSTHLDMEVECHQCHTEVVHSFRERGNYRPQMISICAECHKPEDDGGIAFSLYDGDACSICHVGVDYLSERSTKEALDEGCLACHGDSFDPKIIEVPKEVDPQIWAQGRQVHPKHLQTEVRCIDCHRKTQHDGIYTTFDSEERARVAQPCVVCHTSHPSIEPVNFPPEDI